MSLNANSRMTGKAEVMPPGWQIAPDKRPSLPRYDGI
jgi:hypothetical protein